jgi:hypothetical protein
MCIAPEQRLVQTRATIDSLIAVGIREVYLADNSGPRWAGPDESYFAPARLLRIETPVFDNIGISEIHLLRAALRELPDDGPVMKVSGRYLLRKHPDPTLGGADLLGRFYRTGRVRLMSTRGYVARSRDVLDTFLRQLLREIYSDAARIVGPRSFARIVLGSLRPKSVDWRYEDPPLAVEAAACAVIERWNWRVHPVDRLYLEGQAGSVPGLYISE